MFVRKMDYGAASGTFDCNDETSVVTFASRPIEKAKVEWTVSDRGLVDKGRALAVWLPQDKGPPVLFCNVYGHASNDILRKKHIHGVLTSLASLRACGRWICVGDWNETPLEGEVAALVANGVVHFLDEANGLDVRELPATRPTGTRCIDYGLFKGFAGRTCAGRKQMPGPSDHDIVLYDMLLPDAPQRCIYDTAALLAV